MDDYLDFAKKVTQVKVDEQVLERVKDTYYKSYKNKMPECFPSLEGTNSRDYENPWADEPIVDDVAKILAEEKAAGGLLNKELKKGAVTIVPVYHHCKNPVEIQKCHDDGINKEYVKDTNYELTDLTKEQQERIYQTLRVFESRTPELPHPVKDTLTMEEIMIRSGCKPPPECEEKPMPVKKLAKRKINQIIVFYLDAANEQTYWDVKEKMPDNVHTMLVSVLNSEQCRTESIILQE